MKKLATVLTVLCALAGFLTLANPANADAVQTGREEIFSIVGDPVNGEPVQLEGESTYVVKEKLLKDGTVLIDVRVTAHGAGLGLWSRTPYQFNETYTSSWIDPVGLEYSVGSRDLMRLISHGSSPNVTIEQTMSVTRDANGVYTFDFAYGYDVKGRGK